MSPDAQLLNARRTSARIALVLVVTLATVFMLFSGGRIGAVSFAQQQTTTSAVGIKFVNPDSETSNEITGNPDGVDSAYHLVAWANTLPPNASVEFKYQSGANPEVSIGTGEKIGDDTYHLFWPLASMPTDGSYTLKVSLFSGTTLVSQDSESVVVNNTEPPATPPDPNNRDRTSAVEITYPTNGGPVGFYQRGGTVWRAQIQVKASSNTQNVQTFYTTSNPGAEPEWKACSGSTGETKANAESDGVTCALQGADQPSMVRGVAAVSFDQDQFNATGGFQDRDSGDAHRTAGYVQDPTTVTVTPPTQRVDPTTGQTTFPCSGPFTVSVKDQNGTAVAGAHLDVHASGPSDTLQFDDSDAGNAHKPPDQGGHTSTEATADCEASNPSTTAGSSNQGDHEVGGEGDVKHIETTDGTNDKGEFQFKMLARTSGPTQISVWADKDGNDLFCDDEPNAAASIGWGADAPTPTGVTPDQTTCPSPTSTSPSPSQSPSPSNTTQSPTATTTTTPTESPTTPPPRVRKFNTTVRIDHNRNPSVFHGTVRSKENRCESRREVVLKEQRSRRPDKIVGSDTTNRDGEWRIPLPKANGSYYAVALRDNRPGPDNDTIVCRRGKSDTKQVRRG